MDEICRDCSPVFCEINNNVPSFSKDLPEAHLPCQTPNMECFAKIVNCGIHTTKVAKDSILYVLLGSEYVSDYLGVLFINMN